MKRSPPVAHRSFLRRVVLVCFLERTGSSNRLASGKLSVSRYLLPVDLSFFFCNRLPFHYVPVMR